MSEHEPRDEVESDVEPPEQCDALSEFKLTHTYSGSSRPRQPRKVDALVRCVRDLGHDGEHRSEGAFRKWRDEWTVGWIDEAVGDDE